MQLNFYAKVDRQLTYDKTIHVKGADETDWLSTNLNWGSAPTVGSLIESEVVRGTDLKYISKDVTSYVKSRMATGDTSTFAFEVGTCYQECLYIPMNGETKPQLTVVLKEIGNVTIKENPSKISYLKGEDLDLTGGQIEIEYGDGTKIIEDMDSENVAVTGYNKEQIGEQTLTVSYGSTTTTLDVEVF